MKALLFILICLAFTWYPKDYSGQIIYVIDGDTFVFQTEEGNLKIRMYGIDAPEKNQEFGLESKIYLETYLHKNAIIEHKDIDKYGRTLGILMIKDQNINLEEIKYGYAWHYKYYYNNAEFEQAQKEAQKKRLGLWKNNNPIPPWVFRKNKNLNQNSIENE